MEKKRFVLVVLIGLCLFMFILLYENQPTMPVSNVTYVKRVAISFDDGPHFERTKMLLDGLKERGVKATFFMVGNRVEGNEDLILRMFEEGHQIGNHSYSHADLTKLSKEEALWEISETNRVIEEITGKKVEYIRPPCGFWNDNLEKEVEMTPVFWDVDPLDWRTVNAGDVVERVLSNVEDGDIILFHDIYESSVVAALEVVDRLLDQGYVFVTVEEIMNE